jgi:Fe-S-cluster containining protein
VDRQQPLQLIRLDQIAQTLDRQAFQLLKQAGATGRPEDQPACHNGCAACCHQLVPLTTVEAQRIARHLSALPRSDRRDLGRNIDRQVQKFGEWVKKRPEGGIQDPEVNRDYLSRRIPCAFLGTKNECRIYPVRPIICRGHHALETNAHCQNADHPIRTIPALDRATAVAMKEARDLTASLGSATQGGLMTTFASLFRAALTGQLPDDK